MMVKIKYEYVKHGLLHGLLTRDRIRLTAPLKVKTRVGGHQVSFEPITLEKDGTLILDTGYEWDGASGPTWDTECTMRGSAVHDAFYRLMSEGKLPVGERWQADAELWWLMRADGAAWWRALYYLAAVQAFGACHIKTA